MQIRFLWNVLRAAKPIKRFLMAEQATHVSAQRQPSRDYGEGGGLIHPVTIKLVSEELKSIYTPELNSLADIFKKNGYELRIAGGAVRDLLMGIKPHDIDFATTATPDQMKEMFERESIRMINTKGEKHGTITPRINDKENFEVTTLRIDLTTDGRHAEVKFTTDWKVDANRRDLTINCLFMDLDGTVYDYFNGIEDIKAKRVLFVGDAATRIKEDYLRILRYFRFYGRIASSADAHEEHTLQAIRDNVGGLERISGERLWSELKKILEGNYAGELIKTMVDVGVAPYLGLPEQPNMEEFEVVWQRLKGDKYNAITLLSGLLHDLQDSCILHQRLRFSAFQRDLLFFLMQHKEKELAVDYPDDEELAIRQYQMLVLTSKFKTTDVKEWATELLKLQGQTQLATRLSEWQIPRFPINGNMVKEKGCPGGKEMGLVMQQLKLRWVDSGFKLDAEELLALIPEVLAELREKVPQPPPAAGGPGS